MNMQELETAKRLKLNFVVVIFTDSSYGVIEWNQMKKFKKTFGTKFTNPDFVKLAESFGCKGVKIKKTADLKKYLDKALKDNDVWVIDVPVDYSENLKLTEKLGANICQI